MRDRISKLIGVPLAKIDSIFLFGSRVYGCADYGSDYDFLVVSEHVRNGQEIRRGDLNVHLRSRAGFADTVEAHKVVPLECLFGPPSAKLLDQHQWPFRLDIARLRAEFAEKAQEDADRAMADVGSPRSRRRLYHATRIMLFGRQIIDTGRISDYSAANWLLQCDIELLEMAYLEARAGFLDLTD